MCPLQVYLTMPLPPFIKSDGQDFLLSVKVQPRSSADQVGKIIGAELQIKLRAPPVDNAANEALLAFIAATLQARRNQVELVRGLHSRHKILRLRGVALESIVKILELITSISAAATPS
jgi:uncharacterized protein